MNRAEKQQAVVDLAAKLGEVKCLYLADFTGLDVEAVTDLRRRLSSSEVEFLVVKNSIARRALEDSPYAELGKSLEGPNAFAMSRVDVVSAAKILTEFAKEADDLPSIKTGAIEGEVISLDEIRRLATLPPREQLLAEIVGYAKAPITGLVYTLSGVLAAFVRTLDAVRAAREAAGDDAPAAAETAVAELSSEGDDDQELEVSAEAEAAVEEAEAAVEEAEESEAAEAPVDEPEVEEPPAEEPEVAEAPAEDSEPAEAPEASAAEELDEPEAPVESDTDEEKQSQ